MNDPRRRSAERVDEILALVDAALLANTITPPESKEST